MADRGTLTMETFDTEVKDGPSRPEDAPPGNYIALAVSDIGSGIPQHVLPHMFEPFFRQATRKGSGLGLAQVFGIAKLSGGGVRIKRRLGHGSTVTVLFPSVQISSHIRSELIREVGNGRPAGNVLLSTMTRRCLRVPRGFSMPWGTWRRRSIAEPMHFDRSRLIRRSMLSSRISPCRT